MDRQENEYAKRKPDVSALKSNGYKVISFERVEGDGYRGIEFVQQVPNGQMQYERWICAPGRLYVFASSWSPGHNQPQELERIVKSWRLLAPKR